MLDRSEIEGIGHCYPLKVEKLLEKTATQSVKCSMKTEWEHEPIKEVKN